MFQTNDGITISEISSVRLSVLGQRRPKLINWGWTIILEII